MKNITLIFAVFVWIFASCNSTESTPVDRSQMVERVPAKKIGKYKSLNATEFKDMLASHPGTIIDIREVDETRYGIIEGAIILPLYEQNFEASLNELKKDTPVYVYDGSGSLSVIAAKTLLSNEFSEIYSLVGGVTAWGMEGYDMVSPKIIKGEF